MSLKDEILDTNKLQQVFVNADEAISQVNAAFSEVYKQMPKPLDAKLRLLINSIKSVLLTVRYFQRMISPKRPR